MAFLVREEGKLYFNVLDQTSGQAPRSSRASQSSKGNDQVPTLLLLRGLGRSSRYWLGFDKIMAKHFRVVTMDPRGVGRSTQPLHWSDSIDVLAEDCLAILDQLEVKNFHIYGLSFGGMVASVIAAKAPHRVESLMIGASSSADYRGFRVSASLLPKLLIALRAGGFQDALLSACVPAHVLRSWRPEIQVAWQDILKAEGFPLLSTLKQLRIAAGHSIRGKLNAIEYPILFVHGSMDDFVPERNSRQLHRLVKGSVLKIIKGAGHEISIGFEEEFAKVLREFAFGHTRVGVRATKV